MAKKYIPSGYQIINLNVTIDGGVITVKESEDEKILKDLLFVSIITKPILLNIVDETNDYKSCGFAVWSDNCIGLEYYFNQVRVSYYLYLDSGVLTGLFAEE